MSVPLLDYLPCDLTTYSQIVFPAWRQAHQGSFQPLCELVSSTRHISFFPAQPSTRSVFCKAARLLLQGRRRFFMLVVMHRRTTTEKIEQQYKDAVILDVTSRGSYPWVRFSPFYPHGGIPVPFSPSWASASVEGIWQGLKVFEHADIDPQKFEITTMKHLKRSTRTYGKVLGHRKGVAGEQLLSYGEARRAIYLPCYCWVLEHRLQEQLNELKRLEQERPVVFLDYETNSDIDDLSRPLSHAALIKCYLEGNWPASASGGEIEYSAKDELTH